MKDNREFLEGIYEKYDEYQNEKKLKITKFKRYIPMVALASVVIIAVATTTIRPKEKPDIIITNPTTETSLAKVENFQNFYNLLQNQKDTGLNVLQAENLEDSVKSTTKSDAVSESYSETNTQVQGVDEADIVKTDGKYIYYIVENKVEIIDIQNSSQKVSEITFDTTNTNLIELYLHDNKLVVIASINEIKNETGKAFYSTADVAYVDGIKIKTVAIIYNIQNPEKPEEERRVEVEGNYISSRMIEENMYFATTKNIIQAINMVKHNKIEDLNEDEYKPTYLDTAISTESKMIQFNDIQYFDNSEISNYLIVAGFNLDTNQEVNIETLLGAGDMIYSSNKNMYIAKTSSTFDINTYTLLGYQTKIIKFELQDGNIEYKKDTTVDGKVLNQFSMDEDENGNFRIAVTQDIQNKTTNSLYVLNSNLEAVGTISDLAEGERIKSVRYMDNKGYVVTFEEVDPLFVIDLSDPTNPHVLGELKIPGYSTYLHPYDETHLIGFGNDTKSNGSGGVQNDGLKLSMFDVSDINNPKELFTQKIGTKSAYSEAQYNHKAILYLAQKNIIAFPLQDYQYNNSSSKILIYQIDLNQGFILKSENKQDISKDYKKRYERVIFANNKYYLLSKKQVVVVDENTWNESEKIDF